MVQTVRLLFRMVFPLLMKKFLLVICMQCLVAASVAGDHVLIRGLFQGAEGEEILLMRYADHLSLREKELASATIDEKGSFVMEFQAEAPELLFFRFHHTRNFFYVEPGNSYTVEFEPFSFSDKTEGTDYHPLRLDHSMSIHSEDQAGRGLNDLIRELEDLTEEFIRTRIAGNIRANHQPAMRDLHSQADSLFRDAGHPFFAGYKEYYLARLGRTLNTRRFQPLVEDFFADRPVLYDNPVYMDFFRQLFGNYVFTGSRKVRISELEEAVNIHGSYEAFMAALENDSLLINKRFRELVMLEALKKMFGMEDFEETGVIRILKKVAASGAFPEHRQIAENLLYLHQRFLPGQPAPDLSLKNHRGMKKFPEDFSGRYVYLFFWAGWCNLSMAELGPMEELAEELGEKIHFAGVLTDHDPATAAHLLENEALAASYYHFDGDYRIFSGYGFRNIPYYVLIDPEGNFVKHQFVSPSAGAGEYLHGVADQ